MDKTRANYRHASRVFYFHCKNIAKNLNAIIQANDGGQAGVGKCSHDKQQSQKHKDADICSCIMALQLRKRGYARVLHLVQTILTIEVEAIREDRVNQLFRGNSLGCKIVSTFTAGVGSSYLKLFIEPLIVDVISALDSGQMSGGTCKEFPQVPGKVMQPANTSHHAIGW